MLRPHFAKRPPFRASSLATGKLMAQRSDLFLLWYFQLGLFPLHPQTVEHNYVIPFAMIPPPHFDKQLDQSCLVLQSLINLVNEDPVP